MRTDQRSRWLNEDFGSIPGYSCPRCDVGQLVIKKGWLLSRKNADTLTQPDGYLLHFPEEAKEHFAGLLICSNQGCGESVAVSGILKFSIIPGSMFNDVRKRYIPKFFFPALKIISLGPNCPTNIREQINKSFAHYFNDLSACANSIRIAIEYLVSFFEEKNGIVVPERASLQTRINNFCESCKEVKPFLEATKWIGNSGSHKGIELSKNQILDAYEFIEHCLYELFEKENALAQLKYRAEQINHNRGPLN